MQIHTQLIANDTVYTLETGHDHALGFFINIYDAKAKEGQPGSIDMPYSWDQKFQYWQKKLPEAISEMILGFRSQVEPCN